MFHLSLWLILYFCLDRFPEIPGETEETNEFLVLPTTGQIPFDGLNVEKCVLASGKLSLEFEHFIDEYSNTLKQEFEDGGKHCLPWFMDVIGLNINCALI